MKPNSTNTDWEKRIKGDRSRLILLYDEDYKWQPITIATLKSFIRQLLLTERKKWEEEMKKDLDFLVPVQNNDKHNNALLRLLNFFLEKKK